MPPRTPSGPPGYATNDSPFDYVLITGIDHYPRKMTKDMIQDPSINYLLLSSMIRALGQFRISKVYISTFTSLFYIFNICGSL